MSISRGMDKEDVGHGHSGLSHEKENNAICNNMDRPGECHTKRNQTEKNKYHMISLICGILKNMFINKTEADS